MAQAVDRVLVVDDEEESREINETILTDAGYEVALAKDGIEAWEEFTKNSFDLLVVDRIMPNMSGDELAKRVRGGGFGVPIIMLTGMDRQEDIEEGVKLGINQYICKAHPEFARNLLTWTENLIEGYRRNQNRIREERIKAVRILRQSRKLVEELKKTKMTSFNREVFISFQMACSPWEGDIELLAKKLIESVESLKFPDWSNLQGSLLAKVDGKTARVNVEEGSEIERVMEKAFKTFYVELDRNENRESVPIVWSAPWETHEEGEGISLLIRNLPFDRTSHESELFDIGGESLREAIQGATYRFFEYAVGVIGYHEVHRKFRELVYSASTHLDTATKEMENNRQFQFKVFDSMIAELLDSNALELEAEKYRGLEKILHRKFDDFQKWEMNSLNDVQKLLKWIRKLQSQFKEGEKMQICEEADAKQIGGSQADVEKLLAEFNV